MAFYKANDKYAATLSSGYTAGATTLSVTVVPDNVPTLVCVAKGTAFETIFIVTDKTLNSLTGVSRLKGYTGNLDTGMPVTCLNNAEFINQYSASVSTPESLIQILYGIDGGSTDDYSVSLDVAPTAYTAGMMVVFKANTGNTGACTLNLNSLGAKSIKVNTDVDPATGDIKAGQIVTVIYDGTNFQLQTDVPPSVTADSVTTLTNKDLTDTSNTFPTYCQNKVVSVQVVAGGDSIATGDGQAYITIPLECNGMNLVGVHARVVTAGTTNTTDIQIRNVTDSADMLSTKLTIDSGETGSDTAATPAVIDTTKDDVATNDLLAIDIDAKSTTAPKGLIVVLRFALP